MISRNFVAFRPQPYVRCFCCWLFNISNLQLLRPKGVYFQSCLYFVWTLKLFCPNFRFTIGKFFWRAFIWMVTVKVFIQRRKNCHRFARHDKQHHREVLLSSFHSLQELCSKYRSRIWSEGHSCSRLWTIWKKTAKYMKLFSRRLISRISFTESKQHDSKIVAFWSERAKTMIDDDQQLN